MRWKIAQVVFQGASHIKDMTPCQDFVLAYRSRSTLCVAMSDGAGSAKRSEIGAQNTTRVICDLFTRDFDKIFDMDITAAQDKIVHSVKTCLGIVAKRYSVDKSDLACTLLVVAIKGAQYIAAHIGDGVIGVIENSESKVFSNPENGEFANSTYFITSKNSKSHLRIYRGDYSGISSFFMMTDGAAESLYKRSDMTFAPAIKTISSWLKDFSEEEVNNSLYMNLGDLFRAKSSDDCSFAIVQLNR